MVVASTPETTNPVADQCEANGVPCISTVAPWQPYFFGRQKPSTAPPDAKPFEWTYHFFWGLEDVIAVVPRHVESGPDEQDRRRPVPERRRRQRLGRPDERLPDAARRRPATRIVDPGRYENLTQDFSAQISAFKKAGVEILTGVPLPPDFTTFWTQAVQQGFKPKVASIGKALLFPSSVEALGPTSATGLSSEVWWSPSHPFKSSLTGATAKALADGYTTATGKQWTQPIGFAHALFEVAVDALKRTTNIDDKAAIRDAHQGDDLDTIVGKVDWDAPASPFPNVVEDAARRRPVGQGHRRSRTTWSS